MKRFSLFVLGALVIAGLAGCYKSPTIAIPPVPGKTFVGNPAFTGGAAGVAVYQQPLGPTSVPAFTLGVANGLVGSVSGTVVDAAGNLYVLSTSAQTIYVIHPPVTSTSMPAAVLGPFPAFVNAFEMALDGAGNLWVASSGSNTLFEFAPPFTTGVPAPVLTMTSPQFSFPNGITFDRFGKMYVSNGTANWVAAYLPPFFAGQVAAATISLPAGGHASGTAFDFKGRMFVGDFNTGNVYVFNPPFATGITSAFFIPPPIVSGAVSSGTNTVSFDSSNNLYVTYQFDGATGNVSFFAPGYSHSSSPLFSLSQAGGPYSVSFGF